MEAIHNVFAALFVFQPTWWRWRGMCKFCNGDNIMSTTKIKNGLFFYQLSEPPIKELVFLRHWQQCILKKKVQQEAANLQARNVTPTTSKKIINSFLSFLLACLSVPRKKAEWKVKSVVVHAFEIKQEIWASFGLWEFAHYLPARMQARTLTGLSTLIRKRQAVVAGLLLLELVVFSLTISPWV